MKITQFIRAHRKEIDDYIDSTAGYVPRTASCDCPHSGTDHYHSTGPRNDNDREDWILNDESLRRWARSEGVPI